MDAGLVSPNDHDVRLVSYVRPYSSGEQRSLLLVELGGRDDSTVAQIGQLAELVGGSAARPCGLAYIGVKGFLLRLSTGDVALCHAPAAGDQVHEHPEEW